MSATLHPIPSDQDLVLAYSCTHCESIRAPEVQRLKTEAEYVHTTSSGCIITRSDFYEGWTGTEHGYVQLTTPCSKESCQALTLAEHEEQLYATIKTSRMSFQNTVFNYVNCGIRYHKKPLTLRAKTADETHLAIVHHTYGIETRYWYDDPFLQPFLDFHETLQVFEERVRDGIPCEEDVATALRYLNTFRAIAMKIKPIIETLKEGVKTLATLESYGHAEHFHTIVPGRLHHLKVFDKVAETAVQKFVAEQVIFDRWAARIDEMGELYTGNTPLPTFRTSVACPLE
ncbi:hypothetical protein CLAFUW4_10623 [Fulvia fulva]|uniref:Uncharacterized protein n=1 Tax=Passalora fulva TaxID=5499 RepID=A0A9Q8LGM6_PASFU|nr:uncharacterized protein CLAFUR5_05236 [Fulvia fulva]KAK4616065.1 hypothetical protein CLAFUR4_10628 [Fulvia fulva]KAK4616834.1 hypothetical protein CLAFUR0_10616 [Fulvia fulva]UJO17092.1 hypothetical protein CLAFUR5_05236 [Fulvia fulva]WPV19418.1 hypothetical protein CLAFUW4_10623 [Fulvia fulva]WPV33998.1 hypothetical protein CLAFUW7_10625 [Fulvia fulva]